MSGEREFLLGLLKDQTEHWSDCAVHNAPALPVGRCDCGLIGKVKVSCGCYPTGCECGKFDEAAGDGYDHGWNDAIDEFRAKVTDFLNAKY